MRKLSSVLVAFALVALTFGPATSHGAIRTLSQKLSKFRGPVFVGPAAVGVNWTVKNLCAAYNFPTNLTGGGVIGIAEYGGGYKQSDITLFQNTYMNGTVINLSTVSVNGGTNNPGVDLAADAEVTLDIEIAAAAYYYCTGKVPTIKVFFADPGPTEATFVAATNTMFSTAANAGCDVLSVSWGTAENAVTTSAALSMEAAATAASAKGMTIFVASGDGNSTDERLGQTDGENHISVLASLPHVVAVGGTTKLLASEYVWNNGFSLGTSYSLGTGGGYSTIFPVQSWQLGAPIALAGNNGTGRMIPDVAANADPLTPYLIALDGTIQGAGNGTSAATPLWAALIASSGTKLGFINPKLWAIANRSAFVDIKLGNNNGFQALTGPDACTGLGVPNGTAIAKLFATTATAPTTSNVQASYSAGTLTLTGDAQANSLTVTMQAGVVKVEGANGTKINTTSMFSSVHSGKLKVVANLNDGDDSISFVGIDSSTTNVTLGSGNDKAAFTLSNIQTLTIDGGIGTDLLLTTSTTIGTTVKTAFP